jgi:hypothetical protein
MRILERSKGDTWILFMAYLLIGPVNHGRLAMKYNGRGRLATNKGGSVKERWLETTMRGP